MEQMFKEFGGIGGIMDQRKFLEDLPSRFQELPPDRDGGGGVGGRGGETNDQYDRDFMLKQDSGLKMFFADCQPFWQRYI